MAYTPKGYTQNRTRVPEKKKHSLLAGVLLWLGMLLLTVLGSLLKKCVTFPGYHYNRWGLLTAN